MDTLGHLRKGFSHPLRRILTQTLSCQNFQLQSLKLRGALKVSAETEMGLKKSAGVHLSQDGLRIHDDEYTLALTPVLPSFLLI